IEAQKINLIKINKCLKRTLELISAASAKALPIIKDVIDCVQFPVQNNTDRMHLMQLILMVYQFIQYALNNKLNCLTNAYLALTAVTTPHTDTLKALKCAFLFA
ncbi:hypothetical protein KR054_004361, partial [Drosophila jambulina]